MGRARSAAGNWILFKREKGCKYLITFHFKKPINQMERFAQGSSWPVCGGEFGANPGGV